MITYVFLFLTFFLSATFASAQGFELTAGLTPPNQQKTVLRYSGTFHDKADFPNERANVSQQGLAFSTPIYLTEDSSIAFAGRGDQLKVNPEQGGFSELYDIEFGLTYTKLLGEKKLWAVTGSYGSASDKPFYTPDVSTVGFTFMYMEPKDEKSSWLYLVNYSNNRPILNNIPLPGFAYFYTPSKEFRAVLGVPFASVYWQFVDRWSLNFFTLFPWVIKTSINYSIAGPVQAYFGLDFSQETYYVYGRENKEDRLFYDEKKFFVGFKSPVSQYVMADLEMGHAFDRSFFVAENYEREPSNPLEIGNAFYLKLNLSARF